MYLSGHHVRKRLEDANEGMEKAMKLQAKYKSKLNRMQGELKAVIERCAEKDLEQRVLLKLISRISGSLFSENKARINCQGKELIVRVRI